MNNFNKVFLAVKQYCRDTGQNKNDECFAIIARESNIPFHKLDFYLSTLQNLGLIKYSWDEKTIHLTSFGNKQSRLFPDN